MKNYQTRTIGLNEEQKQLLEIVKSAKATDIVDAAYLVEKTGYAPADLSAMLNTLERYKLIYKDGGEYELWS